MCLDESKLGFQTKELQLQRSLGSQFYFFINKSKKDKQKKNIVVAASCWEFGSELGKLAGWNFQAIWRLNRKLHAKHIKTCLGMAQTSKLILT